MFDSERKKYYHYVVNVLLTIVTQKWIYIFFCFKITIARNGDIVMKCSYTNDAKTTFYYEIFLFYFSIVLLFFIFSKKKLFFCHSRFFLLFLHTHLITIILFVFVIYHFNTHAENADFTATRSMRWGGKKTFFFLSICCKNVYPDDGLQERRE